MGRLILVLSLLAVVAALLMSHLYAENSKPTNPPTTTTHEPEPPEYPNYPNDDTNEGPYFGLVRLPDNELYLAGRQLTLSGMAVKTGIMNAVIVVVYFVVYFISRAITRCREQNYYYKVHLFCKQMNG